MKERHHPCSAEVQKEKIKIPYDQIGLSRVRYKIQYVPHLDTAKLTVLFVRCWRGLRGQSPQARVTREEGEGEGGGVSMVQIM